MDKEQRLSEIMYTVFRTELEPKGTAKGDMLRDIFFLIEYIDGQKRWEKEIKEKYGIQE